METAAHEVLTLDQAQFAELATDAARKVLDERGKYNYDENKPSDLPGNLEYRELQYPSGQKYYG